MCARELANSDLRVLLLEKKSEFGDKLCAGGLTLKDMEVLHLPDHVIEHRIKRAILHSRKRSAVTEVPESFLFTVNRRELGSYQRSLLDGGPVVVRTGRRVTEISPGYVRLDNGKQIAFTYLVGADGYASLVRRYLNIKNEKKLIGFQYTLPREKVDPELEIFMDAGRFSVWYAWVFPHRDNLAVGCCCDPVKVDHMKIRKAFREWMEEKGMDPGEATLESAPIACDYRGVKFGNIFLTGDAAGLASGFTGEGIYQSMVSGMEVGRMIKDPFYEPVQLNRAVQYNRTLAGVMKFLYLAGPFRGAIQELFVHLMSRSAVRNRINKVFSG